MTQNDLKNKRILLTGASKGIGKALAEYLMHMGAQVALHYNSDEQAAVALANRFKETNSKVFKADLSETHQVIRLFEEVTREFKTIDSIILNAGVSIEHSTELPMDSWLKIWKRTLDINLNAVGIMTKLGIDHFRETKGGRFIYIGSRSAFRGETEEFLGYAASKGGMTSLARSVARSFGKENIKAFVVAPGFTRTQMADLFIAKYGEERVLNEIALNELTRPEDIAPLVGLMCSGLMDHATGATIDINAGSHIR